MQGKFENEIKFRNYEEHYSQLLIDINIAIEKLSSVKKEISNNLVKNNQLDNQINEKLLILNSIKLSTEQERYNLSKDKENFINLCDKKNLELEQKVIDETSKLSIIKKENQMLDFEKSKLIKDIQNLNKDSEELSEYQQVFKNNINQYKTELETIKETNQKEISLETELLNNLKASKQTIENEIKELILTNQELDKEVAKKSEFLKNGQEALKEREARISKRERDFGVIERRLAKKFKQEHPDLIFKI